MDILLDSYHEIFFTAIAVAVFVSCAWRNFELATLIVIALAPLYTVRFRDSLPYPTNVLEILVLALSITWLIKKISSDGLRLFQIERIRAALWRGRMFFISIFLICGGAFISVFAGGREHFETSLGQFFVLFIEPVMVAVIAYDVFLSPDTRASPQRELPVAAYVLSSIVVAALSVLGLWFFMPQETSFLSPEGRLRGWYLSANHLAMYLAPALMIVAGYSIGMQRRGTARFWFGIIAAAILVIAIYFTKSYGAWLGIGAGAIAYVVLLLRSNLITSSARTKYVFLGVGIVLLVGAAVLFFETQTTKFQNIFEERGPLASRVIIWNAAFKILGDHPILGIGIGTFQEYYLAYQKYSPPYLEWAVPYPHNIFLAFWLHAGILGFIGFVWLLMLVARHVLRGTSKNDAQPIAYHLSHIVAFAAITTIVIHGLVDTTIWKNDLALIFGVLAVSALRRRNV